MIKNSETKETISIALASDDRYVPHVAALMESIKDSVGTQAFLDLWILDGGISIANQVLLQKQFQMSTQVQGKLNFLPCDGMYKGIKMPERFSAAILYRLSLGRLFPNHQRIIYLDSDMIVMGNLMDVWQLDLQSYTIAAIPDLVMKYLVQNEEEAKRVFHGKTASDHLNQVVQMGGRIDDYFQSGMIMFDLNRYRELDLEDKAIADLQSRFSELPDQDILNKYLLGKTLLIDTKWNMAFGGGYDIAPSLPEPWKKKFQEDLTQPAIIHYAGEYSKPWINPDAPFSYAYWLYLRRTFWYESVRNNKPFQATSVTEAMDQNTRNPLYFILRSLWRILPKKRQTSLSSLARKIVKRLR